MQADERATEDQAMEYRAAEDRTAGAPTPEDRPGVEGVGDDALDAFDAMVAAWFREEVGGPTPVQQHAWDAIRRGEHCLISAPTGTGKTLAAFLTAIDELISGRPGRVLYISPLKALNNDIQRNLHQPLSRLAQRFAREGRTFPDIRVGVRSGDTDQSERRRLVTHPPEILVTTPESLNLMLSSKSGVQGLAGIRLVILDEIHAVLSSKRGTYLMSALERLVPICGEVQRIALSATVRPMNRVAEILGGFEARRSAAAPGGAGEVSYHERPVKVIQIPGNKRYDLKIAHPGPAPGASPAEASMQSSDAHSMVSVVPDVLPGTATPADVREDWWKAITLRLVEHIRRNRSTLIFANSRRMVEKLTRMINEESDLQESGDTMVYAHHGSLSKEIRRVVEERLKAGELRAIVATSSLELGIDIGDIDEVILVQSPFSVASAVQRVGRAGHGVGAVSRATVLPIHPRDLVESVVLVQGISEGAVEEITPPENPLDVLSQIVLSSCLHEAVSVDDLLVSLRSIWAYHSLTRRELELVVEMLAGKYADSRIRDLNPRLTYDRVTGKIRGRKNAAMLLYMSGGVIPDRGYYTLRRADSKAKIGELDEEFVWERSLGEAFPFGNTAWRITGITNNDVLVTPADRSNTVIPFWRAEEQNRPFAFAERIGLFLERMNALLEGSSDAAPSVSGGPGGRASGEGFSGRLVDRLVSEYRMEPAAAEALEAYLGRQRRHTSSALPHRHHVVIECYYDAKNADDAMQVVVHTLWGNAVNKPFSLAVAAAWKNAYGYPLEMYANNDAVLFGLPHDALPEELFTILDGKDITALLRESIEGGGLFGAHFRENAQRALMLPRKSFTDRMPLWLNRLRAKKLLAATADREDFPIVLETWRECMQGEFDVPKLHELLDEVRRGEVTTSVVESVTPSPFADSIIWRRTNDRIYEDDSAAGALRTSLSDELLEEVLHSPHLRPDLPQDVVEAFRRKVQRLAPGYAPESEEDLLAWIVERRFIRRDEWRELIDAMSAAGVEDAQAAADAVMGRLCAVELDDPSHESTGAVSPPMVRGFVADEVWERFSATFGTGDGRRSGDGELLHNGTGSVEDDSDVAAEPAMRLFLDWLSCYPPIPVSAVSTRFPVAAERFDELIDTLTSTGEIVIDQLTENAVEDEVCTRENLERLLRLRRAHARPEVDPLSVGAFQHFLARYHGIVRRGENLEDLETRLDQLFAYPARVELWESDILPARLDPFFPSWLDRAMGESDLMWVGAGNRRTMFLFPSDVDLVADEDSSDLFQIARGDTSSDGTSEDGTSEDGTSEDDASDDDTSSDGTSDEGSSNDRAAATRADAVRRMAQALADTVGVPTADGREQPDSSFGVAFPGAFFLDLARAAGLRSDEATTALWELVWHGVVTNDGMEALRRGIKTRFTPETASSNRSQASLGATSGVAPSMERSRSRTRRSRGAYRRWRATRPMNGRWRPLVMPEPSTDPLEQAELIKERIRLLFARYGVVFRQMLKHELVPFQWRRVFRSLRLMELSGEVVSGHFVHGITGLQFASHEALRELVRPGDDDVVYWLNAADPASLCGVEMPTDDVPLPKRLPTTHMVFHGSRLVLTSHKRGRKVVMHVPADAPRLTDYLMLFGDLLGQEATSIRRVQTQTINGEPAKDSPYASAFRSYGFQGDGRALSLWRRF